MIHETTKSFAITLIILLFSFTLCKKENAFTKIKALTCDNLINDNITTADDCFIAAPNAFTPNGDGLNDRFAIFSKNIKTFKLLIYDVKGNIVFQTEAISNQWDPFSDAVTGKTFYYRIEATSNTNKRIGLCGEVYPLKCVPKNNTTYYFQSQFNSTGFDTSIPSVEPTICP